MKLSAEAENPTIIEFKDRRGTLGNILLIMKK